MPLPVTLDPLESKNIIRHLNGTNNKILNNLYYKKILHSWKIITSKKILEQYQTFFYSLSLK